MKEQTCKMYSTGNKQGSVIASLVFALLVLFITVPGIVWADDENSKTPKIGVGGFLDEDGDGFNDLMPDSDGDGVPDALDPDFRNRQADSVFMRQHLMNGAEDTSGVRYRDMMDDNITRPGFNDMMGPPDHGEPGQFGPGDSTGHGGHRDGRHPRDGGREGGGDDTTGHGGGMWHGKIDVQNNDAIPDDKAIILGDESKNQSDMAIPVKSETALPKVNGRSTNGPELGGK